jgi:hypothetical protein
MPRQFFPQVVEKVVVHTDGATLWHHPVASGVIRCCDIERLKPLSTALSIEMLKALPCDW